MWTSIRSTGNVKLSPSSLSPSRRISMTFGKILWGAVYYHWYTVVVSHKRHKTIFCGLFNLRSHNISMVAGYFARGECSRTPLIYCGAGASMGHSVIYCLGSVIFC